MKTNITFQSVGEYSQTMHMILMFNMTAFRPDHYWGSRYLQEEVKTRWDGHGCSPV